MRILVDKEDCGTSIILTFKATSNNGVEHSHSLRIAKEDIRGFTKQQVITYAFNKLKGYIQNADDEQKHDEIDPDTGLLI